MLGGLSASSPAGDVTTTGSVRAQLRNCAAPALHDGRCSSESLAKGKDPKGRRGGLTEDAAALGRFWLTSPSPRGTGSYRRGPSRGLFRGKLIPFWCHVLGVLFSVFTTWPQEGAIVQRCGCGPLSFAHFPCLNERGVHFVFLTSVVIIIQLYIGVGTSVDKPNYGKKVPPSGL